MWDYVPHGVDTEVFKSISRDDARSRFSKQIGVDLTGKFLVAANSANKGVPGRKGFFEMFSAFAAFAANHPDALLYLHTDKYGAWGENLPTVLSMFGETLKDRVLFADPYYYIAGMLNQNYLNDVYNAADVFLTTSHGEGFGIPIVEAQASGCPVIVTDFSAMSELCFSGWKVPGFPFMHAPGATQRIPAVPMVLQALEQAYEKRGDQGMREAARAGALQYDHKVVFEKYMIPALEKMDAAKQAERERAKIVVIPARTPLTPTLSPTQAEGKGVRPDVSVLIPIWNIKSYGVEQVRKMVDSALDQEGVSVEVVLVDDCSTDDSQLILTTLGRKGQADQGGLPICERRSYGGVQRCSGKGNRAHVH
jgi:hypothetical protein